jgi:hypothetical protein
MAHCRNSLRRVKISTHNKEFIKRIQDLDIRFIGVYTDEDGTWTADVRRDDSTPAERTQLAPIDDAP